MTEDRNSLAWWFPKIEAAGLPVPSTRIVETDVELLALLDGHEPEGFQRFISDLQAAAMQVGGYPFFLRTGHGSGKHDWRETCFVEGALEAHVVALVEWSALADIMGLPTDVWVARALIPTAPLFRCRRYGDFPVTREFRLFVRDNHVEHIQPYWPREAVEQGDPDDPDWESKLAFASKTDDTFALDPLASAACEAVGGGFWSVDFLQDREGRWWLTDMADGDRSFRYDP